METVAEDPAVSRFREYLRINTISLPELDSPGPKPDYGGFIKFNIASLHLLYCVATAEI